MVPEVTDGRLGLGESVTCVGLCRMPVSNKESSKRGLFFLTIEASSFSIVSAIVSSL